MRKTLTLDEDVAKQIKEAGRLPRFEVKLKPCGFQGGVDVLHLNQLNDEMESEAFQRKLAVGSARR